MICMGRSLCNRCLNERNGEERMLRPMTFMIKLMGKILVLPLIAVLTILRWICTLAVSISMFVCELAGGVLIMTGILSFAFGQEPAYMMWRMAATGAGICLLPHVGRWVAVQLTYLTLCVSNIVN